MKIRPKYIIMVLVFWGALFVAGGMKHHVQAAEGNLLIMANPSAPIVYSFEEDGLVEGRKEFVIPANAGENYDIEITFTGSGGANEVLSFAYDKVTDDQMVPNIAKDAEDRSGLLGEPVQAGVEQTRAFSVAALDGDIVITATGNGKVISIQAKKLASNLPGEKTTVYTIGDSLVQTYAEKYAPQTGWGQTLPLYFGEDVNFVNRALGGRSTGNYLRQGRLNQVLCEIAPGDIVLIEFGHNDASSNNKDRYVSVPNYKKNLADIYIKAIRDRGAIPILVTLCNRNQYRRDTSEFIVSFPEYVEAMREVAAQTDTLLIDLNALTVEYFTKLNLELGAGVTNDIIYNYAIAGAYQGEYKEGVSDNTHLQYYGAKLAGGFVAKELHNLNLKGVSEFYAPEEVTEIPSVPEGLTEKKREGFVSRFTWSPSEGADYYKVLVAELVEKGTVDTGVANADAAASSPVYELAGDFETAGYTVVCDFANADAKAEKHYAYKVVAVNALGESAESEIFSFGLELVNENDSPEQTKEPDEQAVADAEAEPGEQPGSESSVPCKTLIAAFVGLLVAALLMVIAFAVVRAKRKKIN